MGLTTSGQTWEEASSPAAVRLVRRFELAWRDSQGKGPPPDPEDFLAEDGDDSPGARLALLRADLGLRREAGEPVGAEWYRQRYPDLGSETLVALVYEDFCLREEDHEDPDPADYLGRFPEVAPQLRRVLDIHGLVGSGQTTASLAPSSSSIKFPEAGQTIAGFHLVEELGRGAFARVFRAEERQLADRPVALKVARAGSREPQTLARLQHTHIVPVHSSRTDPVTGLHLLCMPYFGRVTLAGLLADPKVKVARTGAEIVEALERLEPPGGIRAGHSAGKTALSSRSYAQAIAWWGARMAEALEHAHDRGVLHRDVKPSNVLVTGDGMPMLLDFNLARESVLDDPEEVPSTLGGTLDYMAPEHLEALADGLADRVDARSDLYGLGVVLYEALAGERPFETPRRARSAAELLLRAAEERRTEAPWLREAHPEVPAALEAVVRRCLDPDPEHRYASAGDLAIDLQAVADDGPLKFAREPLASRAVRWARRNRRALATTPPVLIAIVAVAFILIKIRLFRSDNDAKIREVIANATAAETAGDFHAAATQYETASLLARERPSFFDLLKRTKEEPGLAGAIGSARDDADLLKRARVGPRLAGVIGSARDDADLFKRAREGARRAGVIGKARDDADKFFRLAAPLRFQLTGFLGNPNAASKDVKDALLLFYVLEENPWTSRADMEWLDPARRDRLIKEVNELLFLWAVARSKDTTSGRESAESLVALCDKALTFATPKGPWEALRASLKARLAGESPGTASDDHPANEKSALGCFQWGCLRESEGRSERALAWFRNAVRLEPNNYWHEYYLAYVAHKVLRYEEALMHYHTAVALEPGSPWVRFSRGRFYRERRDWAAALDDLNRAVEGFRDKPEMKQARLERGFTRQLLGDSARARADYDWVIANDPQGDFARAARLNRAKLEADSGAVGRALVECDALLAEDPENLSARLSRALLELRQGAAESAEADLSVLVERQGGRDDLVLANRALARLLLGRPADAEADAEAAMRIHPIPSRERLWLRTRLASGRVQELRVDRPDELARLPVGGPALARDLRSAANRLRAESSGDGPAALKARLARAVLLTALGDAEGEREADRAVALAPLSPQVYLIRARVRRERGDLKDALADVRRGLDLQSNDAPLWELQGVLELELGEPKQALADLDRAIRLGASDSVRGARAAALLALGNAEAAVREWSIALAFDPEDPRAFLGRARALGRLGRWNQALVDLEEATAWSGDQPGLALPIALAAARCLPTHRHQLPRVLSLARRAWTSSRAIRATSAH